MNRVRDAVTILNNAIKVIAEACIYGTVFCIGIMMPFVYVLVSAIYSSGWYHLLWIAGLYPVVGLEIMFLTYCKELFLKVLEDDEMD